MLCNGGMPSAGLWYGGFQVPTGVSMVVVTVMTTGRYSVSVNLRVVVRNELGQIAC